MEHATDRARRAPRAVPDDDPDKTFKLRPGATGPAAAAPMPAAETQPTVAPTSPAEHQPTAALRQAAPAPPVALALAAVLLIAMGCAAWWLLDYTPPQPPPPRVVTAQDKAPADRQASEAQIASHRSDQLTVFRLVDNPRIVVLDFPNLTEQGLTMNRLAGFIEKASIPKDHVLDDAALAREIAKAGDTVESYYYGHDYAVADMMRFFALAERDGVQLNSREHALREMLVLKGLTGAGPAHAVITVTQVDGDTIDDFTRRILLRHELSHGEYFTNPAYAAYVRDAWATLLSDAERAAFVRFLGEQNYDTTNDDLMANEMQAFLAFTPDERYIDPRKLGMTPEALRSLRDRFVAGMPEGWLRALADAPLP